MNSHSWSLQETGGGVVADTTGGSHGTIDGSVTLGAAGPGGDYPRAAAFTGATVSPIVLDSPFLLSRKHAWTIKFWAKQDNATQQGMILGDRTSPLSFVWLTSSFGGLVVRPSNSVLFTGANNGLDVVFAVSSATRTKWSHYELSHDVSGATCQLTLHVDGTLISTEDVSLGIDLAINTIGAGHTSNTFSMRGMIAGVEISGTEIDYAKPDKVVLVAGQSNAEGRFVNHQQYVHPTQFASMFADGQWTELYDSGQYGEVWPLVATHWLTERDESVGFIYAATSGTGLVETPDWADGGATYAAAIAAVDAAAVERIDAILWFQGERDANEDVVGSTYLDGLHDLVARLHQDLPGKPPLICGQINGVVDGTTTEIRDAQSDAWSSEDISAGPVTYDIGPLADNLHFTTDAEAITLAGRWWAAIDETLFSGSNGMPPSLLSAVVDGSTIQLTFDRELAVATTYEAAAWKFTDDGTEMAVNSAEQITDRSVTLQLAGVPNTSRKQIVLGYDISARGLEVPRGIGGQPALPEHFDVSIPAQQPGMSSSLKQILAARKQQRAIVIR